MQQHGNHDISLANAKLIDYSEKLKQNLDYYQNQVKKATINATENVIKRSNLKKAAVLVAIFEHSLHPYILLTKRSSNLSSHKSEVALPGGKQDPSDVNIVETAIRESEEEIGLNRRHIKVIGVMQPTFAMKSKLMVYPVVAFITNLENIKLKINEDEVEDVFAVPLQIFLMKKIHIRKKVPFGNQDFFINVFTWCRSDPYIGDNAISFLNVSESHKSDKTFSIFGLTASLCIYSAMLYFDKMPEMVFNDSNTANSLYDVFSERIENLDNLLKLYINTSKL